VPSPFDALTRDVARGMGAQSVLLFACEDTALTNVVSAWGTAADEHAAGGHALQRAFAGGVLRRGRAAAGRLEPRADATGADGQGHITHAIAAPVATRRALRGVLLAGYSGRLPADRELQLWVIQRYCGLAGLCLHDPGVLDGLLASTSRDALTSCLNYAGALRALAAEVKRSARYGFDVSCAFVDLEGFEHVNDEHGPVHANKALVTAATGMRAGVRASDTVGRRSGGDEFMVIFPQTSEADALRLARRLQARIRTATLALQMEPVDASIGVAEWTGGSVEQLLRDADGALRIAKREPGAIVSATPNRPR
jgi:diguanylate cyclase (GGDEF)-like protein